MTDGTESRAVVESERGSFVDLGMALYKRLTGRGAAINYEFRNMEVEVPRDTGADAPRALWKLNGVLRAHHHRRAGQSQPALSAPMLRIEADLEPSIDGQAATLTGSGQVLRLTLGSARTLRSLRAVSLPNLGISGGQAPTFRDLPGVLAGQGLTLEVANARGLLLILGAEAAGRSFTLPGFGKIAHLALASRRTALRLALNA